MVQQFMNRPLSMSVNMNAIFYSVLSMLINSSLEGLFYDRSDNATSATEWLTIFIVCVACGIMAVLENDWVREIKRSG
jgi:hypothetical protein